MFQETCSALKWKSPGTTVWSCINTPIISLKYQWTIWIESQLAKYIRKPNETGVICYKTYYKWFNPTLYTWML